MAGFLCLSACWGEMRSCLCGEGKPAVSVRKDVMLDTEQALDERSVIRCLLKVSLDNIIEYC